jgi:hypothetical protein
MTTAEHAIDLRQIPAWHRPAVNLRERIGDRFLAMLAFILIGYAVGGRGFAYIGFPPVFIGEVTLLLGVLAFMGSRRWTWIFCDAHAWPLLALCGWGLSGTVPYVSVYAIDSLRDAMVWGYSAFGLILAVLIVDRPQRLSHFMGRYRTFVPWFLCLVPLVFSVYRFLSGGGSTRPEWPWVSVAIIQMKEGDVLVHLAGVMAFWVSGLGGPTPWKWVALLAINAAAMGVVDRAGMVAFGAVFFLCVLLKPMHTVGQRIIITVLFLSVVLWASNIKVPVPSGKGREISFDQIVTNLGSILFDTGSDGLDSTKEWRMDWWRLIGDYTFHGEYFWTGKGYGINLADDDGFQVLQDNSLRNPHNVHMTILARGGVPGLALWALAQASWGVWIAASLLRARRRGQQQWAGLFFFLFTYWFALLINGSFDVYLEGPMGGIWFWTVYGAGLAALSVYRTNPDAFQMQPLEQRLRIENR